jgi:hypothetical protein
MIIKLMFGGNLYTIPLNLNIDILNNYKNNSIFDNVSITKYNNNKLVSDIRIKNDKVYTNEEIDEIVNYFTNIITKVKLNNSNITIESLKKGEIFGEGYAGILYDFEHNNIFYCVKIEKNYNNSYSIDNILNKDKIVYSLHKHIDDNLKFNIYPKGTEIKNFNIDTLINILLIKEYLIDINNKIDLTYEGLSLYFCFGDIKKENIIYIDNTIKLIDIDDYKIYLKNYYTNINALPITLFFLNYAFDENFKNKFSADNLINHVFYMKYYDFVCILFCIIEYLFNIDLSFDNSINILFNTLDSNHNNIIKNIKEKNKINIKYYIYYLLYNKIRYKVFSIDNNINYYTLELITLHIISLFYLWYININLSHDNKEYDINYEKLQIVHMKYYLDIDYIDDMEQFIKGFGFNEIYNFNYKNIIINKDKFNFINTINTIVKDNIKNIDNCNDISNNNNIKNIDNEYFKKYINNLNFYDGMYIRFILKNKKIIEDFL